VVTKLDLPWSRCPNTGATIKALAARRIDVIVLQLGKLDLTSVVGKLMLNMLAAIAEMERDLLLEHTEFGLACAKAERMTLGLSPSTRDAQRTTMTRQHQVGQLISALTRNLSISCASVMYAVNPVPAICWKSC
jgi:putative DNA-invertase from lambdoid prophage Rac